jgi:hypothetical protein
VKHRAATLHPLIVAPPEDPPGMREDSADGDTALREALPRFVECRLEKLIH